MPTALLLAGQGSERVGMAAESAAGCAGCHEAFLTADRTLDQPLSRLMTEGPEDVLRQTQTAQPALLTLGVAQGRHLLARGIGPVAVAGHSLGQYTALVLAGALAFEDALTLVAARGRMMQQAVPHGRGAMVAVSGLSREQLVRVCDGAQEYGQVGVACFNAPRRAVLSGDAAAVSAAAGACWDEGGGTTELPVSVPFHSELLQPMLTGFAREVAATPVADARIPVVDNVTAQPLREATAIRRSLVDQVVAPVLFEESLRTLAALGARRFVGCGPGRAGLTFASLTLPGIRRMSFPEAAAAESGAEGGGAHGGQVPA
ncbi:MAG: ACP S-malonyltransferase [Thermocrispum sp.]